ncbi:signal peptidase II [Pedobacter sp. UYP24]
MKVTKNITRVAILMIVLAIVGCDQISKNIVRTEVNFNERIKLGIDNITLTKVENTGAFLSVGSFLPASVKFILLIALPCVVLLLGLYYIMINSKLPKAVVIGVAFIIGGGIGNLFDRVVFGSVTDFLHIDFVIFKTGIFNVADMAIMMGMLLIAITIYKNKIVVFSS